MDNVGLLNKFRGHIICILNFLQNPKTSYKYVDLSRDLKVDLVNLGDLPDIFYLLLGDKDFCHTFVKHGKRVRDYNQLNGSLTSLIFGFDKQWQYFTGDHCHPIPLKKDFNRDTYNAALGYYSLKKKNLYWVGENLELRKDYLRELIKYIDSIVQPS